MNGKEIDRIIRQCGHTQDNKRSVYMYYKKNHPSNKDFANYIKEKYGNGGSYPAYVDGDWDTGIHYDWESFGYMNGKKCKGLKITKRTHNPRKTIEEVDIPWTEVAERTASLIDNGSFMDVKDYYTGTSRWNLRKLIWVQ